LEVNSNATVGPHLLLHGDERDEAVAESRLRERAAGGGRVILGHEHPAIGISDGVASHVKCPCFVVGTNFLVLPAFSRWAAGGDIRGDRFMSPYARLRPTERAIAVVAGKLLPVALAKK
jgi:metallophosphoesterase superfamily enzyme